MLLRVNLSPKMYNHAILARNYLSYIIEFPLVTFAFSLILGDPFMVKEGGETFFKKCFLCGINIAGDICRGLFYMGGLMTRQRGKEFPKMYFPVI